MSQKEQIKNLLNEHEKLTQGELAFNMYGDYSHQTNIYSALMSLVNSGTIIRTGDHPSYYSLVTGEQAIAQNHERGERPMRSTINNQCTGNVILLNKPFLGGWLNRQGNIGHEIIDFLLTDNGDYYVYNNPWGVCPDNIWIDGTTEFTKLRKEKYLGKYMVLTSEERGKDFDILYVIELAEKLHRYHKKSDDRTLFRNDQNAVKTLIRRKNIKYNDKYLDEIYQNDDSLYVNFKGRKIYKAVNPILVTGLRYNFQRNKGYLYDDKNSDDYNTLKGIIDTAIENGNLAEFTPRSVSPEQIGQLNANKTFINLTKQEDNEQIFTNILHSILEQGDLLKHFCVKFGKGRTFNSTETFRVLREVKVVDGRMDVCAESESQRVIIENKINSGLNGIRPADNTTQLSTYYNWGREKSTEPLCFVVAPNYRCSEIQREIQQRDPNMESVYLVKNYGDVAKFIEEEYNNGNIPNIYPYYSLVPQIIDSFRNLSYSTKEDLYARMFLEATN